MIKKAMNMLAIGSKTVHPVSWINKVEMITPTLPRVSART